MNYTTYLFDFDYTLADSSRGIVTCFRNVLTRHGYTDVTDEAIKRTIGKTLEESFSILTGITDPDRLTAFRKEYGKEADTHMTVNTVLFLETKSVLLALKDAGAAIGIISTKYRFRIQELLDLHFPGNFFNVIIGGEDVKAHKPSPEGLLLAIKQLHATKAETLYIGDSTIDAATAKAAGVDFAGITHGVTTAEELSKYPHRKIMKSLEELLENDEPPNDGKKQTIEETSDAEKPSETEETPKADTLQDSDETPVADEASATDIESVNVKAASPLPYPRKKKMVNIWQLLLLAFLIWLAYEGGKVFLLLSSILLFYILSKRRILPQRVSDFIAPWWNPCEARLRLIHIKMIRGKQVPPISKEQHNTCLNCGTVYNGSYCNRCGQSRNTPRYRFSNALKNIVGGFTNIDNGFGRTLLDLLYRPGYMIRDFIAGKRIIYFRPFQTLFILAALYIMAVQLVDPDALHRDEQDKKKTQQEALISAREQLQQQMEKSKNETEKQQLAYTIEALETNLEKFEKKKKKDKATDSIPDKPADDEDKDLLTDFVDSTASVSDKFEKFFQNSPFLQKVWNLLKGWAHGNKAFLIISTLPLFALATLLAFYRKKKNRRLSYNLTEHIFVQAYIACQILFISILVIPFNGTARVDDLYEVPTWCIFALFCLDYKQLYGYNWWRSFWTTLLMFFYSLLLLVVFAILLVALLIGAVYILELFL